MTPSFIKSIQQALLEGGFYTGKIDGVWGPVSAAAMQAAVQALSLRITPTAPLSLPPPARAPLAWGRAVTAGFRDKVRSICEVLQFNPDWLMSCMAFESGETFRSDIKNAAGSGAVGLIQFMPRTAEELGTTTDALAQLNPEQQLEFVYRYFLPYKGRLKTLSDVYMAILWPAAIGKPETSVLWSQDSKPTTYRQNAGLDANLDLTITKQEAASKVAAKLSKGSGANLALI